MAKLFWLQPDNSIVEFPLKAEQSIIGRSSRCDVRIKHPGISSEHAVVRQVAGAATLEDMGSTNGTRVNGRRIEQLHALRHGDQIGVGRERLMYFAELDSAANFVQPEPLTPFALPAPIGERVNTSSTVTLPLQSQQSPMPMPMAPLQSAMPPPALTTAAVGSAITDEPLLDISLIAALPKGSTLASRTTDTPAASSAPIEPPPPPSGSKIAAAQAPPDVAQTTSAMPMQALMGSVAVLSGPATGKRYPLTQPSMTLGKEGKQVIELVRAGPTRWQIVQREGATPAYVNGDALAGVRELAAGDVIELTGVRLRFDITLTRP
jgi:predicted component of type VI protein secretion system